MRERRHRRAAHAHVRVCESIAERRERHRAVVGGTRERAQRRGAHPRIARLELDGRRARERGRRRVECRDDARRVARLEQLGQHGFALDAETARRLGAHLRIDVGEARAQRRGDRRFPQRGRRQRAQRHASHGSVGIGERVAPQRRIRFDRRQRFEARRAQARTRVRRRHRAPAP